ncbi:MAG TPA: hypothetical protein VMM79_10320, partial [Longimicrobiales bacterium]|nr:hypothetical protein [Longimicrobiales bacterium]
MLRLFDVAMSLEGEDGVTQRTAWVELSRAAGKAYEAITGDAIPFHFDEWNLLATIHVMAASHANGWI